MDPRETLNQAERHLEGGDLEECAEFLTYYIQWRAAGGFEPTWQITMGVDFHGRPVKPLTMGGDEFCESLTERLKTARAERAEQTLIDAANDHTDSEP